MPEGAPIKTVSFVSLGCPKNLVDSEKMLGLLAEDGLMPVSAGGPTAAHDDASNTDLDAGRISEYAIDDADAVVINTCGFLESSKEESLGVIRAAVRAKEEGRVQRVVVAGCLVQRHRAKLNEWVQGIDAMIGVFDRDHVVEAVRGPRRDAITAEEAPPYWIHANALVKAKAKGINTIGLTVNGKDGKGLGYFESDAGRLRLTPRHYAYLRISEGCNQACAFCTIPSIRGKMRSKPIEAIVAEAHELLKDGALELSLIGQDTTSFGDDIAQGWNPSTGTGGLPALLDAVCDVADQYAKADGLPRWVRLMYAYPSNFRDEFIEAFARRCAESSLVPYIDIPLQHASDRMLTLMRRHVSAAQQSELMHRLREQVPGLAIRTTFISGFPGETEEDHEQLLEFIDEHGFDAVGVFEYSKEDGTPAGTMEADPALAVSPEVKRRRKSEIMALQQELAFEQAQFLADQFDPDQPHDSGLRLDILIEENTGDTHDDATIFKGRAYFQAPQIDASTLVMAQGDLPIGSFVRCAVVASEGYDLIAIPEAELA